MLIPHLIFIATAGFLNANALPNASDPNIQSENNNHQLPQANQYYPQIKIHIPPTPGTTTMAPPIVAQTTPPNDAVGVKWTKISDRLNLPNFFKDLDFRPVIKQPNGSPKFGNPYNPKVPELSVKVVFYVRNYDDTSDLQVTYGANERGYEVSYKVLPSFSGNGYGYNTFNNPPNSQGQNPNG